MHGWFYVQLSKKSWTVSNGGLGDNGRFMKKFFGGSCLPQCGNGEKGFSMLVASDVNCPTDISKGQLISKQNCRAVTSSKKRTMDFCLGSLLLQG